MQHWVKKVSLAIFLCLTVTMFAGRSQAADGPGKLVIVKAIYGDLPDGNKVDVTTKLAGMVKDDQISVMVTNDNFTDPAENVAKVLQVDYTIDGVAHTKTVNENTSLYLAGKPALVILKAVYGDLPDGQKNDETAKLAEMVTADGLKVAATNENFGDPAEGSEKKLQVDYTLNGEKHSLSVAENQTLTIRIKPSRLVIVHAFYGDLPDGSKNDVTDKLNDKVADDSLSVDANNDSFGDPADGVTKKLKVDYTFDGKPGSKTIDEGETLSLPEK